MKQLAAVEVVVRQDSLRVVAEVKQGSWQVVVGEEQPMKQAHWELWEEAEGAMQGFLHEVEEAEDLKVPDSDLEVEEGQRPFVPLGKEEVH